MDAIFYGLIFLLIDIRINSISLIPAFVGYILMYYGLEKVAHESEHFAAVRPLCLFMAIYQGCLYAVSFLGGFSIFSVNFVLSLVSTVMGLYILYRIVQGVVETESHYPGAELEAETLRRRWWWLLVFDGVLMLMSMLLTQAFFALLLVLAGFVVAILFLMAFHRCRRAYAAAVEKAAADGENAAFQGPDAE